jgi:glycosyltransferase involved in cell wall biosynthesis
MPSIVIPAYNEANGIERCLRALLVDAVDNPVDNPVDNLVIVVVANACKDDTAARARAFGNGVIVIETEQGGKTNAVNLGERTLRARGLDLYPRLFLDGDIELVPGSLPAMLAAAQAGESPRIVAARPRFDASRSSLPVRLFYQGEAFNPYHRSGAPNGSGTFMVNAAGRARWDEFPAILADDSFVERRFAPSERATVAGATAIVRVPRTFTALRRISARKRLGAYELDKVAPPRADDRGSAGTFGVVARAMLPNPLHWPAFVLWAAVKSVERFESRAAARKQGTDRWQHDTTSRT